MIDPDYQLAFEFASDLAKQLITLSTGVLAISITFLKDIVGPEKLTTKPVLIRILGLSWFLLFITIVAGIWALSALTGTLAPVGNDVRTLEIGVNARIPAGIQVLAFISSIFLLILFGIRSLKQPEKGTKM